MRAPKKKKGGGPFLWNKIFCAGGNSFPEMKASVGFYEKEKTQIVEKKRKEKKKKFNHENACPHPFVPFPTIAWSSWPGLINYPSSGKGGAGGGKGVTNSSERCDNSLIKTSLHPVLSFFFLFFFFFLFSFGWRDLSAGPSYAEIQTIAKPILVSTRFHSVSSNDGK